MTDFEPIQEIKQGKRKKYKYHKIVYDSKEECYFSWWLCEMVAMEFVAGWKYPLEEYVLCEKKEYIYSQQLKTKIKLVPRMLLKKHVYTPDFQIVWNNHSGVTKFFHKLNGLEENIKQPLFAQLIDDLWQSIIDVKGKHQPYQNKDTEFSLNQKWMMQRHNVYVNKIVPQKLFKDTFYPERYLWTDKLARKRKIK